MSASFCYFGFLYYNVHLKPDHKLLLVYLLLCLCQVLRILGDPVGFQGVDSVYYLEAAQNLALGNGPIAKPFPNPEFTDTSVPVYLTTFPVGYPVAIAAVMLPFGLSAFWASKVVNLLCLSFALLALGGLLGLGSIWRAVWKVR